ncbi:MAG TPA: hypothetical protein ENL03_03050 [Phycisphaerae bacterium]|nr:hypothetical protein [Phycisphaerae bacterium]
MTIAACYLSSDGVVLGADSTSTVFVSDPVGQSGDYHHFNFAQKVFEFGNNGSTAGVLLWGLGSLGDVSYRTLIAEAADEAERSYPDGLEGVVDIICSFLWKEYNTAYGHLVTRVSELEKTSEKSEEEWMEFYNLQQNLSGGLCVGGRWGASRRFKAFEITFNPSCLKPAVKELAIGTPKFWGCPNLIDRLTFGIDEYLYDRISQSEKWTGSNEELFELVWQGSLGQPKNIPLREAIDWIYASIYTTIKGMKFSHLAPVCGGPIELAVITSDRPFRWVRHKKLGEAVNSNIRNEN